MTVRRGVRLGVDAGSVRVGLAVSDPEGLLATPLRTLLRETRADRKIADQEFTDREFTDREIDEIGQIVADRSVMEVIVGLPRSLSGAEGRAAEAARRYAVVIARRVAPVPVRLVDERMSTVTAHRRLREAGVKGRRQRPVVDQEAAVVILQSALEFEHASGQPPGLLVGEGGPVGRA